MICKVRKSLVRAGLLKRLSRKFRAFQAQLIPKPYKSRRQRRRENPKSMKLIDEFYYSFNERWRVNREDGQIQTKIEGTSKWRHANEFELESVNKKILADFRPVIDLAKSGLLKRLRTEVSA